MKSYKLIKEYPGSDSLGTIITGSKETMYSKGFFYIKYDWAHVETHPEYWEEVIEKDYEIVAMGIAEGTILEFKDGVCVKRSDEYSVGGTANLISILKEQYHKDSIHSVKRLSDGEIFTVGDCFDAGLGSRTIESIWVDKEGVLGFNHEHGRITNTLGTGVFSKAKKLQPVLFTTEDGVGIRKGDNAYIVSKDFTLLPGVYYDIQSDGRISSRKYFSTREAAKKYIDSQKILFTTEDGKDIFTGDKIWYVNKESLDLDYFTVHANVTFRSDINVYFLTEEAAKKYILLNKPAISINEFWKISSMCMSNSAVTRVLEELVKKRV
jgi:hypothetical protein